MKLPENKRFHRFINLAPADFVYPNDRSEQYTIIEISMFSGRQAETKKRLIRSIFKRLETAIGIHPQDVEICIRESPAENWGIRGKVGDELSLPYRIDV